MKGRSAPNFSYPSAATVVFGVYLSARAAFRLDPDSGPAIRPRVDSCGFLRWRSL